MINAEHGLKIKTSPFRLAFIYIVQVYDKTLQMKKNAFCFTRSVLTYNNLAVQHPRETQRLLVLPMAVHLARHVARCAGTAQRCTNGHAFAPFVRRAEKVSPAWGRTRAAPYICGMMGVNPSPIGSRLAIGARARRFATQAPVQNIFEVDQQTFVPVCAFLLHQEVSSLCLENSRKGHDHAPEKHCRCRVLLMLL